MKKPVKKLRKSGGKLRAKVARRPLADNASISTFSSKTGQKLGRLIIFEGPDGVGKTTLTKWLLHQLGAKGVDCARFSFPGRQPGSLAAHVYRLYHSPRRYHVRLLNPAAVQLLLTAAHIEVIDQQVMPALRKGTTVLLDRYWWSTWVYGRASGVSTKFLDQLLKLERMSWHGVRPDVALLVERRTLTKPTASTRRLNELYNRLIGAEQRKRSYIARKFANDGSLAAVGNRLLDFLTTQVSVRDRRSSI